MRPSLLVPSLALLALAPAASACTVNNCAEVRVAHGTSGGLVAECVLAGRVPQGFVVEAAATTTTPGAGVTVRCRAFARGTLVFDESASDVAGVAAFAQTFRSGADVVVCVEASSATATVSDCS